MNRFALIAVAVCTGALSACGIKSASLYEGPQLPISEQVVLSAIGLYPERRLSLNVFSVDGKKVDLMRTSELYIMPGEHSIEVGITKDLEFSAGVMITSTWKGATVTIPLTAVAGHTYIPNAHILENDQFTAYFDDMGTGFKKECMPLRRFALFYGGSADGKKPGC